MSTVFAIGTIIFYFGTALLGVLFAILIRKKMWTQFPVFTTYIAFQFASSVILLVFYRAFPWVVYWYGYWTQAAVEIILSLAMVAEWYSQTLRPYPAIRRSALRAFLVAGVVLLAVAVYMVLTAPVSDHPREGVTHTLLVLDRSGNFIRFGFIFLYFVSCRLFGLSMRHYLLGIALGMGICSGVGVLNETLRIQLGWRSVGYFTLIAPIGFDIGAVIWCYFLATSESKVSVSSLPESASLARWNSALEELLAG